MVTVEEMLDSLKSPAKLFSDNTNEVVAAFKGAVPKSFWVNRSAIGNRLNVLYTKKWGPLILAHGSIKWIRWHDH